MVNNSEKIIKKLITKAKSIDERINIFDNYCPKSVENKSGECLFWNMVTNIYGLFCDCAREQVYEKDNLFKLFYNYGIISKDDYDFIKKFYGDISDLRSWFCHNRNNNLFYYHSKCKRIDKLIIKIFALSSKTPHSLESMDQNEWSLMNYNIHSRYEEYLDIFVKALDRLIETEKKNELIREWLIVYSQALYNDKELISNVLADIVSYEIKNSGIIISISQGINIFKQQLSSKDYSTEDIVKVVCDIENAKYNSMEIIKESFSRINLSLDDL